MTHAILDLPLVTPSAARGTSIEPLFEAGRKAGKGMLPNMYQAMANAPGVLSTYLHGYSEFHATSTLTSIQREVVFLVISEENGCDYCMAAHSLVCDMAGVPRKVTDAIRNREAIPDDRLQVLADTVRELLLSRGRPSQQALQEFLVAGYTQAQILEIVLAIAVKTLSNYTNHLFETPLDAPFKVREYSAYKLGQKMVEAFRAQ
ncbi:carboxymuconolactone decarboxylase family protein [Blastomonas sp.]|uniref:carboxymuconolactone decarboxylase family protein n=1 Tax=Blastomonas sp. TaxID=1909299 RepID=UPI003593F32B